MFGGSFCKTRNKILTTTKQPICRIICHGPLHIKQQKFLLVTPAWHSASSKWQIDDGWVQWPTRLSILPPFTPQVPSTPRSGSGCSLAAQNLSMQFYCSSCFSPTLTVCRFKNRKKMNITFFKDKNDQRNSRVTLRQKETKNALKI